MRSKHICTVIIVVICLTGFSVAQSKCVDLRALNTQNLAVDPTGNGNWILPPGTTSGILNWTQFSPNYVEYIPPATGGSSYPNAVAGRYYDFTQVWHFNDANGDEIGTFTVGSYHASFPLPAGKGGMGNFVGSGKITGGTGIFEDATGILTETGPYLIWFGEDGWTYGKYNATYIARICMK